MCIAIITTAHPTYPYIVLSNRDEYLARPTARATWWKEPHQHVLGGRDLQREAQGTWLGMTKQGRLAILTNFREDNQVLVEGTRSRGEMPNAYVMVPPRSTESPEGFAARLVEESVTGVGGFSLLFGQLTGKSSEKSDSSALGIVSNRTSNAKGIIWILGQKAQTTERTCALSNSHFGDRAWPKVVQGEELTEEAVRQSVECEESQEQLLERLFEVLSTDTLPKWKPGDDMVTAVKELRKSILIPPIGGGSDTVQKSADELAAARTSDTIKTSTTGLYGTQKQTVILVDDVGRTTFVERTLFDENAQPLVKGEGDIKYQFQIEGWKGYVE